VFIDAERVGTSNQFYEKFNIRNKVLQTIEHLFKKQISIIKNRNKEKRNNVDKTLTDRFLKEKNYRDEVINLLNVGVENNEEDK
jgi:hypothetical protein